MRVFLVVFTWLFWCTEGFVPPSRPAYNKVVQERSSRSRSRCVRRFLTLSAIPNAWDTLTSGLATLVRLNRGVQVRIDPNSTTSSSSSSSSALTNDDDPNRREQQPLRILELYDVENHPACRRVRERLTELDLCVERVLPCGSPTSVGRRALLLQQQQPPQQKEADGTTSLVLPTIVAETAGGDLVLEQGAPKILALLDLKMGVTNDENDDRSWQTTLGDLVDVVGGAAATLLRWGRGTRASSDELLGARPTQPLVLYDYEGNQFCRLVREVLHELDLPYNLRAAGKGSPRRAAELLPLANATTCPYLVDPNSVDATGSPLQMRESADIIRYLYTTYAKWIPPDPSLQWLSQNVLSFVKPIFDILTPLQVGADNNILNTYSPQQQADNDDDYTVQVNAARTQIERDIRAHPIVLYTYEWSPFSGQAKALLESLGVTNYTELSLGQEWIPGLMAPGGAATRAALWEMTGQSSLPHLFVGGQSIGGLFSGTPGLLPALEDDTDSFVEMIGQAQRGKRFVPDKIQGQR